MARTDAIPENSALTKDYAALGLNKEVESHVETVRDTVRKTEVEVEDDRGRVIDSTRDQDDLNRR